MRDMNRSNLKSKYIAFKAKHPKIHIANILLSMFLPFCIVSLLLIFFKVEPGRGVLAIYSIVGSFVLGGGLALCVAVDYDKEVFWRLNVYPIVIGALITICNVFCAYNKLPCFELDEALLSFQLTCYLSIFYFLISYFSSVRGAVSDYISARTHLNENQIDKRKQGIFNCLWYRKIHKDFGMGWIYYLNVFFSVMLTLFLIGSGILVFSKKAAKLVLILGLLTSLAGIIFGVYILAAAVKNKRSYFKSKRKNLLNKIPYFEEVGNAVMFLLFAWLQVKSFIAI